MKQKTLEKWISFIVDFGIAGFIAYSVAQNPDSFQPWAVFILALIFFRITEFANRVLKRIDTLENTTTSKDETPRTRQSGR